MKNLAIFLHEHPHIDKVYLNSKNEWVFSPNHAHPIEMSREEVFEAAEFDDIDNEDVRLNDLSEENKALKTEIEAYLEKEAGYQQKIDRLEIENKDLNDSIKAFKSEIKKLQNK